MLKSFVSRVRKTRKPSWQTRRQRTKSMQPQRPDQAKIDRQKEDRKRRPIREERREKAAQDAAWYEAGKIAVEARATASVRHDMIT